MVLIFVALLMVSMLVVAAAVVDVGAVYAHRRQDQSAADVAALGAAQELPDVTRATSVGKDMAHDTLGTVLSEANWNGCDGDPGALPVPSPSANCISFNQSRTQLRVRLPDQTYEAAFAGVVGVDEMRHSAFAIASVGNYGFGGVLPFAMPAGAGGADGLGCLKSGSGGLSEPPCSGSSSGNFGTIELGFFGNSLLGTPLDCNPGKGGVDNNIAVGADHQLAVADASGTRVDTAACPDGDPPPNAANTLTGNADVGDGLFSGDEFSDGGPARLQRTDGHLFDGEGALRSVHGIDVDDNPLWRFIDENLSSGTGEGGDVPQSCEREQFDGSPANPALPPAVRDHLSGFDEPERMTKLLERCFAHYMHGSWSDGGDAFELDPRVGCGGDTATPCEDPVFTVNSSSSDSPDLFDIQYTPRFAYVPELSGDFPSGSGTVTFESFRAVFIQRLRVGNGKNADRFDPGFGPSSLGGGSGTVREATAWVFPEDMLPNGLAKEDAPFAIGKNRFVQLVR